MQPLELLKAPEGKFRVFGYDAIINRSFLVDDYEQGSEAISVARARDRGVTERQTQKKASGFYVVDSRGNMLYPPFLKGIQLKI